MSHHLNAVIERINHVLWQIDLKPLPFFFRLLIWISRVLYVIARELSTGELNLRAMSLVYTTLLSLVPLLAVSFSVLKGFGVHNQIEPYLLNLFQFLGDKGPQVAAHVIGFVNNVQVSVLGGVGLALLFYTVLSLMQKIESSLNHVWRVERMRNLAQRFSSYLSVILIGPVLIFSAIAITASVLNADVVQFLLTKEPFGTLFVMLSKLVPYILVSIAFAFVYIFIPNTRVRLLPALAGGLFAGVLWQSTGWAFALFIASSPKYTAIYSSFAILVLVLIWFYINWLVLLLGSLVAFYVQNPRYISRQRVQWVLSGRLKERLVLMVMTLVGLRHYRRQRPWALEALAERLALPLDAVGRQVDMLVREGFLAETSDEPTTYLPAQDIESICLIDLVQASRSEGESDFLNDQYVAPLEPVDQVIDHMNLALSAAVGETTVRDLVLRALPGKSDQAPVGD